MTDPATLLNYASVSISALALIASTAISLGALKVARDAKRQAAPDVFGEFEVYEKRDDAPGDVAPIMIHITARNRGLKTAHVEHFEVTDADTRGNHSVRFYLDDTAVLQEGPALPASVPETRKVEWTYYVWELKLGWYHKVPITEPRKIYKKLLLPYLSVALEDGSHVVFANRTGGYGHWVFETFVGWRDKRRQRALTATPDDAPDESHGEDPSPPPSRTIR